MRLLIVTIGQHPYPIDPKARSHGWSGRPWPPRRRAPRAAVRAFEALAGRYPDDVRATYLASDAAAMLAAWTAAMTEGAVSRNLKAWECDALICAAADDVDFFDQARRAAAEIPNAEFVSIEGTYYFGADVAPVDQVLPAVLRLLGAT